MRKHFLFACLAKAGAISLSFAAASVAAQLPSPQDRPSEIIVTATRTARDLEDLPAAATVITRDRIEETPGLALDDVLRTAPSMDLGRNPSYQQHPTSNNISMRGLLTGVANHALVLVDGVPINDSFSGFVQWSRVPNGLVDHVEIIRGGGSNLWGTYALGGVVNIITRAPKERETAIEASYGSFGTARASALLAGKVSAGISLAANIDYDRTDSFQPAPRDERMPLDVPPAYDAGSINLQAHFDPNSTLTGYVRGHWFQNHQRLDSPLAVNRQNTGDLSGGVTKQLESGTLTLTGFYHDGTFVTDNTNPITEVRVDEFLQNRHTTNVNDRGASLQWSRHISELIPELSAGIDVRLVSGRDNGDIFDETRAHLRTDVGSGKQQATGAYFLVSIKPLTALEVLASARWNHWRSYNGFDGASGFGAVPDKSESAVTPRVAIRYAFSSTLALRAAAYKAFNAPTLDSLYRSYSAAGFIGLPNSQLNPERLRGGEIGFDVVRQNWRVQITAFESTVTDLLTSRNLETGDPLLPAGFAFGSININAAELRSRGIEAEARYSISERWTLDASYTHTDAALQQNPLDPTSIGKQLDGVPRNSGSIGVGYRTPLGWSASVRARNIGAITTLFLKRPLPRTTVFDGTVAYAPKPKWSVFAQIQNVLSEEYLADDQGFTPPQRGTPFSVVMGIRATFE